MPKLYVKYFSKDLKPIKQAHKKEWFDLRAADDYVIYPGDMAYIRLGVAIQLPDGYEAILAMRSSASRKYGIIPANGIGVIDNKYCGDNDEWIIPVVNFTDYKSYVKKNDRICQFKVVEQQPVFDIITVEELRNVDRGGFGSTGTR